LWNPGDANAEAHVAGPQVDPADPVIRLSHHGTFLLPPGCSALLPTNQIRITLVSSYVVMSLWLLEHKVTSIEEIAP
jgi:hypothetical protein